jgi:hypothetical protein
VLTEGEYNGILLPGRHYIAVKEDFSNLEEVLKEIKRDALRKQIVETAYQEIVESGKYTYRQFVDFVISRSLPVAVRSGNKPLSVKAYYSIVHRWMGFVNVIDRLIDLAHGRMVMPLRQRVLGR